MQRAAGDLALQIEERDFERGDSDGAPAVVVRRKRGGGVGAATGDRCLDGARQAIEIERVEAGQFFDICRARLAEVIEKLLKAELIRLGWPLTKTHDLEIFSGELRSRHSDLHAAVAPLCTAFADAYFTGRYPGFDLEDPDWPALRAQLAAVTALAEKIRARLPS